MAKQEIERLGREGGRAEVDEYAAELWNERGATKANVHESLLQTLAQGVLGWDEGAINAGVAELVGVRGEKNRARFYAAYNRGAAARIAELIAELIGETQ